MSSEELDRRLADLNRDFAGVTGGSFQNFYCPVTFRDEPAELCRAHVVPEVFPNSDRAWTVQRKDVDGFFGSVIESDFAALALKGKHNALDALQDKQLRRQLRPTVRLDGEKVQFYRPEGAVPESHTPIIVDPDDKRIQLALKLTPSDALASESRNWELGIERDLRAPVLAGVLRSAHLTLFHLVGYRFALSAGGHYIGSDILGSYFRACTGMARSKAAAAAVSHFSQCANLVRPLIKWPDSLEGTVTDRRLYLCKTPAWSWAFLVFVRTGEHMHAALIPCFDQDHAVARFFKFLHGAEATLAAHLTVFDGEKWNVSTAAAQFNWPAPRFSD